MMHPRRPGEVHQTAKVYCPGCRRRLTGPHQQRKDFSVVTCSRKVGDGICGASVITVAMAEGLTWVRHLTADEVELVMRHPGEGAAEICQRLGVTPRAKPKGKAA